jgi:hypothetical protein
VDSSEQPGSKTSNAKAISIIASTFEQLTSLGYGTNLFPTSQDKLLAVFPHLPICLIAQNKRVLSDSLKYLVCLLPPGGAVASLM